MYMQNFSFIIWREWYLIHSLFSKVWITFNWIFKNLIIESYFEPQVLMPTVHEWIARKFKNHAVDIEPWGLHWSWATDPDFVSIIWEVFTSLNTMLLSTEWQCHERTSKTITDLNHYDSIDSPKVNLSIFKLLSYQFNSHSNFNWTSYSNMRERST